MVKRGRSSSNPLQVAAFLFRRDFRLVDNTGLSLLRRRVSNQSLGILPLFFFNPVQCDPERNAYFGKACFEFMCRSLRHLNDVQLEGRLVCLYGSDSDCLETVLSAGYDIKYLGFNRDVTPFARERDAKLEKWCQSKGIECVTSDADYTLFELNTVLTDAGKPYRVFTPFYRKILFHYFNKISLPDSTPVVIEDWFVSSTAKDDIRNAKPRLAQKVGDSGKKCFVRDVDLSSLSSVFPNLTDKGGRDEGLSRLARIADAINYILERDDIPGDCTTHLSPHLKFGTVSIREAMKIAVENLGKEHGFTRQLIWREFYAMLIFHYPQLVQGQIKTIQTQGKQDVDCVNQPLDTKYINFPWSWDDNAFTAFKEGQTGVPLVDASVRCLMQTGWCHNRCRMIISNFLVKILFVDWREGERWYSTVGVDYDVPNNNGGWLWSSGQGADAQPYFRTFNPFRQSAQHDPNAVFIKKWIPELRDVPAKIIHEWDVYCEKHRKGGEHKQLTLKDSTDGKKKVSERSKLCGKMLDDIKYPSPIVNVKERTKWVIDQYKKYVKSINEEK
ncbi:putative DNA repair enzyme [Trypanosoma theileri]|uniref:Putative DNA repair enzyme n=1 Tax=Trypanosoma theileri TaxID=67003 RepID=A0A1X0P0R5_9TRYP|nr:putative DNA repair enzyme [Trypanosoma theileri]ORC90492.1 putative DNA repair enzyme [Trypanosoma theileri]